MTESRSWPLLHASGKTIVELVETRRNITSPEGEGAGNELDPVRNGE
jgi:hypothetical protein